jgi:O-antigen/teichoic acid export membrane protein
MNSTLKKFQGLLFENRTINQTILKNMTWLGVGKLGSRFVRGFLVIYAARVLGAHEWGIFSYALNLIALCAVIADIGISPTLTREIAQQSDSDSKPGLLSTIFYLKLALVSPAIIGIYLLAAYLPVLSSLQPVISLFALILLLDTFRQLGFSIIKARERMEVQAGLYLLTNAIIVGLGIILLMKRPSVTSLTYAYTIGTILGTCATWLYIRTRITHLRTAFNWSFDWAHAKDVITAAWPFAITTAMGGLMISTDLFIIGLLLPAQDVGMYSVADKVMQFVYAPSLIMATSMFPALSRLVATQRAQVTHIVSSTLNLIWFGGGVVSLVGICTAPWIVQLLFGYEYSAAVQPLQILLLTISTRFASVLLCHVMFVYDRRSTLIAYAVLGIIGNAVLDLVLIPFLHTHGAALATLIIQIVSSVYLWRAFMHESSKQVGQHGSDQQLSQQ